MGHSRPHSAAAVHIYFPDPWPKKKHRRHRLIGDHFPALAREVLVAGGTVFLRTDDADYFQQMNEVFDAAKEFQKTKTPAELAAITTEATQRGIDCAPEMGQLAERSQEHVVAVANNSMQREWSPPPGWTAALRIWPSPSCGGEYGPSSPIQAEL